MNGLDVHFMMDDAIRRELAERGHDVNVNDPIECATLCIKIASDTNWTLAIDPLGDGEWSAYYTKGVLRDYVGGADGDTLAQALARTALVGLRLTNTRAPAKPATQTPEKTIRLMALNPATHKVEEVYPESEFRLADAVPLFLGPGGQWFTVPGVSTASVYAEWLAQQGAAPDPNERADEIAAQLRDMGFEAAVDTNGQVVVSLSRRKLPKWEVIGALGLDAEMEDLFHEHEDGSVRIDA